MKANNLGELLDLVEQVNIYLKINGDTKVNVISSEGQETVNASDVLTLANDTLLSLMLKVSDQQKVIDNLKSLKNVHDSNKIYH